MLAAGDGRVRLGASSQEHRNFDARPAYNAAQQLSARLVQPRFAGRFAQPDITATFDEATGVTRTLGSYTGTLTPPAKGAARDLAKTFAFENAAALGITEADLADMELTDEVYTAATGMTNLYFRQRHLGLSVYNGQLQVNLAKDGAILSVNNGFVPSLAALAGSIGPALSADLAVASSAANLSIGLSSAPVLRSIAMVSAERRSTVDAPGLTAEPIEARLMWLPINVNEVALVWRFQIQTIDGQHYFDFTVDAETGKVWTRIDWVAADSYRVYREPVESANHSSPPQPADGRTVATNPANSVASRLGWHNDGTTAWLTHRGNNVHAYDDRDANNAPPASEPMCTAARDCDFPVNFAAAPSTYTSAAVSNLFYWNNLIHDVTYHYGFNEAAGNFQVDNFGLGGAGGDRVLAEAQDAGGTNNANFATPPDGAQPRMQMFEWSTSTPSRDGDFDNAIIVHEYGHGISNRLVGGPTNVSCLGNAQQPGEGWSDWLGLWFTARPGDVGTTGRGIGTYALNQPTTGPGIRTQRYSTDPAVNTWTYASINGMAVPHGVGSVWAQVLWEVYWTLVNAHGYGTDLHNANGTAGNQRAMLYVIQGLKNTACSPTFVDARNGIIAAAQAAHGGADVCRLWQTFASFGLGTDAVSGGAGSTSPTNGFQVPAQCGSAPTPAVIVSPSPGTTLPGSSVTFTWTAGVGVSQYHLYVGSAFGGFDLYNGSQGTATSGTVAALPTDGRTLYVRLWSLINTAWQYHDYTYTASNVTTPSMTNPAPGSTLASSAVTFTWTSGTGVSQYHLYVGSTFSGYDLYNASQGTATSGFVPGLPTDGRTLYVRLWFLTSSGWQFRDYTYTAVTIVPATMTSPVPGTTFSSPSVTFAWTTGTGVSQYYLYVGSSLGGSDLYAASQGAATSGTVTGLPTDGRMLYVRLWSLTVLGWQFRDYTYTAITIVPAAMTSPVPGSTLPGSSVTFSWTTGVGVSQYYLYVGSSLGSYDLYAASQGASTSGTVIGLPTDSRALYVRLWSLTVLGWQFRDYTYTAFGVSACVANTPCTVDLSMCAEWQKAPAWQGQTSLQGTMVLAYYTSHKNWMCQTAIPQAWPVVPEPGWWCGSVVNQCVCSPADGCY